MYNLEVKDLHNFMVGTEGVVAHNNYGIIQSLVDGIFGATILYHRPYKCIEYGKALRSYFRNNGVPIQSKRWQLTLNGLDYNTVIGFDMPNGSTINISTTGFHEFTIVNNKIYDNNVFSGMEVSEYLQRIQIPPGLGIKETVVVD